jgi:hypothetical protein
VYFTAQGCGWGTLVRYMASQYGADATGCTLAKEQKAWADGKIKTDKVAINPPETCAPVLRHSPVHDCATPCIHWRSHQLLRVCAG